MKLGIIGAGKVGISIGYILQKKGIPLVGFSSTRKDALDVAKSFCGDSLLYTTDNFTLVKASDVIGITTQDRNVKLVAQSISQAFQNLHGKVFFHTSGSQSINSLLSLKERGAIVGSIHPLQTFPDVESAIRAMPETYIFVEGEDDALPVLRFLSERLGYRTILIESEKKVLYHLCAVFVCNLLCALLYAGSKLMEMVGTGLEPFFPIIRSTLRNIEEKGPIFSLTGPVIRGDVNTILSHLENIKDKPQFLDVYRALSLFALEIAEKRGAIDENAKMEIEKVLKNF